MNNVFNKITGASSKRGDKTPPNAPINKKEYIKAHNTNDNDIPKNNRIVPKFIPSNSDTNLPQLNSYNKTKIKKDQQYPVLQLLGIPLNLDWNNLISEKDIDEVGFTLTAPTGIDPDEVETFCDSVQNDIREYRKLLELKQKHFIMLLDEIVSLEDKLIEQQQENELANFIIQSKTSEEQLKEELVDLRLENGELREKNKSLEKDINQLKKSIALLNKETPAIELRPKNVPLPDLSINSDLNKKQNFTENDFSDVFDDLTS